MNEESPQVPAVVSGGIDQNAAEKFNSNLARFFRDDAMPFVNSFFSFSEKFNAMHVDAKGLMAVLAQLSTSEVKVSTFGNSQHEVAGFEVTDTVSGDVMQINYYAIFGNAGYSADIRMFDKERKEKLYLRLPRDDFSFESLKEYILRIDNKYIRRTDGNEDMLTHTGAELAYQTRENKSETARMNDLRIDLSNLNKNFFSFGKKEKIAELQKEYDELVKKCALGFYAGVQTVVTVSSQEVQSIFLRASVLMRKASKAFAAFDESGVKKIESPE